MNPTNYYIIITILIILILIIGTLGIMYNNRFNICRYNPSPWCYLDWTCDNITPGICTGTLQPCDASDPNTSPSCYVNYCECKFPKEPAKQLSCILDGCKSILVDSNGNPCQPGQEQNCVLGYNKNTCYTSFNNANFNN